MAAIMSNSDSAVETKARRAFTVDVEDWYHGIELPRSSWLGKDNRLDRGLDKILELLEKLNIKATFFVLGAVALSNPKSVKKIARLGHEIGSHTMYHEKIYDLTPRTFLEQEKQCKKILEDLTECKVIGFRAPYFSITSESLWALEILKSLGYEYDSSISPVQTWRYGISGVKPGIYQLDSGLIEFTPSIGNFMSHTYGLGGAYFRLYPYQLTKSAILKLQLDGNPAMFYIHPWELDNGHPVIKMEARAFITHYSNLRTTSRKLERLFSDFSFQTASQIIENAKLDKKILKLDLSKDLET